MPFGWDEEVAAPFPCQGLPPMDSALAASPPGDFTVSFRVAWWNRGVDAAGSASACSGRSTPRAEYAYRVEWLGVTYDVAGQFLSLPNRDGTLQLEVVSPVDKTKLVGSAAAAWIAANKN